MMKLGASEVVDGLCMCAERASAMNAPPGPWELLWTEPSVPSRGIAEASVMTIEGL
jgi:hypothetical protein